MFRSRRLSAKPYSAAIPTVFMHIPKTSGVALASALEVAIAPRSAVFGYDRAMFGGFDAFDTIAPRAEAFDLPRPRRPARRRRFRARTHLVLDAAATVLREPISRVLSHWLYWRTQSEDHLRPWGDWAQLTYTSRGSLIDFLSCRSVACQIDNLYARMLLWPHRLVPNDDFIGERNDKSVVRSAIDRLKQFAYVDLIENPRF